MKKNSLRCKLYFLSIIAFIIFADCGKWPDIVNTKNDVESLSTKVTSIRARGLPDKDILSLKRLQNLRVIFFDAGQAVLDAKITDRGLENLASIQLPNLKILMLGYCYNITNDGLRYAAKLKTLENLSLMGCVGIDDNGLQYLVEMPSLERLDLRGCPNITDQGIIILAKMKNLKELLFGGCKNVSPEGVKRLQGLMPNCKITKDEQEWSGHQVPK
jgi:hypothetical protein